MYRFIHTATASGEFPGPENLPQHGIEESLQLRKKLLLSILAMVPAALMPLAASGQASPVADRPEPSYKYEAYAGYAYTSLNQVNQSRYGLEGFNLSLTRNWGKYFGVLGEGSYYKWASSSTTPGNPGNPSVSAVLFGPTLHAPLYGNLSIILDVLLGGEHTGGENMTPKVSFASGFGGGLDYKLNSRFSARVCGERIGDSFSLTGNTSGLNYSPHTHWNARATVGVVYHF
jgi:hypothetical protein